MQNCWWPEVVEAGWICEAGPDPQKVLEATRSFRPPDTAPQGLFGDGHSAEKIVREIVSFVEEKQEPRWHRLGACSDLPAACFTAFIFDGYRRLIDGLKSAGYLFLTFPKAQAALNDSTPFALLRHDIDMELEAALKLAEIEAEAGVQATYFFLVRTETYNLFSSAGTATISRILKMGHHLGLHFDCASYDAESSVENLRAACGREAALLEQWFGRPVEVVSYHRPNKLVLSGLDALSAPRPHTYMPLFTGPITYLSDSRGCWAHGGPLDSVAYAERRPLHILVHPIWWNDRPIGPFEVLERYADRKGSALETELAKNCSIYRVGRLKEEI